MGTLEDPKTWVPYINTKDCNQGFCSLSCPQWCYIIFPPPPPFVFHDDKPQSGPSFSPLVIAIIGILASAFLLVSYYAIISNYCGKNSEISRPPNDQEIELDDHNHDPFNHEPWFIRTNGLEEALIKTITLVKYKKGDGLVGTSDCSVCLGEFLEDDILRVLPKCKHAFHVACIDTWLKSHSSCPLCSANIIPTFAQPTHTSPPLLVIDNNNNNNNHPRDYDFSSRNEVENEEIISSDEGRVTGVVEQHNNNTQLDPTLHDVRRGSDVRSFTSVMRTNRDVIEQASGNLPKSPFRALGDVSVIDIRDNGDGRTIRRSISMDHSYEPRLPISDILRFDQGQDFQVENYQFHDQFLEGAAGEGSEESGVSSSNTRSGVLNCVKNSIAMKRSFSSGRLLHIKQGRGTKAVLPV